MKTHYKKLFFSLKIILTIGIIFYLLKMLNFHLLWEGLQKISLHTLLTALLFCFLSILFQSLRWYRFTRRYFNASIWQQILLFWRANFLNLVSPASLGGDVYRIAVSDKSTITFGLIIRERLIGLFGFSLCYLIFLFALIKNNGYQSIASFFIDTGFICLAGFIGLLLLQIILPVIIKLSTRYTFVRWNARLLEFASAARYESILEFIQLSALTILSIISWAMVFYVLLAGMITEHTSQLFQTAGLSSIIVEISRWIPATIQGIGIREGVATYVFKLLNFPGETGFLVAGLAYIINNLTLIAVGFIGFLSTWLTSSTEVKNFT